MDNKGNRTEKLIDFIRSSGIELNYGKNKARGNKGLFIAKNKAFRIDIAKGQEENMGILLHEFAHYIHYKYDKTLKSLDFIFPDLDEKTQDELIELTVTLIPKNSVKPFFEQTEILNKDIKELSLKIMAKYPDFKISSPFSPLERKIPYPLSFLLKYDRVRFAGKVYSIENADLDELTGVYLKLKSRQRALRRVNSRITKLNRYYNSPGELFARCIEMYFTNKEAVAQKAPNVYIMLNNAINSYTVPELAGLAKICLN